MRPNLHFVVEKEAGKEAARGRKGPFFADHICPCYYRILMPELHKHASFRQGPVQRERTRRGGRKRLDKGGDKKSPREEEAFRRNNSRGDLFFHITTVVRESAGTQITQHSGTRSGFSITPSQSKTFGVFPARAFTFDEGRHSFYSEKQRLESVIALLLLLFWFSLIYRHPSFSC